METKPIITLDLHGYVNPTLLHPSTPPHNVNNEYDLYIKHGLPNALNIETGIAALGYPEVTRARIPFRDDAPGVWDDFPPIYVPSFAMLQSSIPYTIEAPLQPSGTGATAIRRADIDTDVHDVAIKTSLKYIQDHRNEVIFDQAEGYRRGWAGEPLRDIPVGYVPGWGPEDKYNTTFPRAYVIPAGTRQRSAPAAKRVVDLLLASGGRVTAPRPPSPPAATPTPPGTYILDMHQPKRGLVNSLLEPGIDVTDRVDDLYAGPGGWSQALTWGATVDTLWEELPAVTRPSAIYSGVVTPVSPGRRTPTCVLDPQDAEDVLAINALLGQGVKVHAADRRLGAASRAAPARRSPRRPTTRGLTLKRRRRPPGAARRSPTRSSSPTTAAPRCVTRSRARLRGRAVTATTLTTTLTPDVDVLLVGATLNPATLNAANRAALDAFLARRGGVVGLGTAGSAFTTNGGLLTATGTSGAEPRQRRRNVVNNGGPVINGAQPRAWIFPPVWYTNLGANAVVEQSYAADPLLSGWWRPKTRTNGQAQRRRQGERRPRGRARRHRRRPDRHQHGHPPARQGPAAAARPRALSGPRRRRPPRRPRPTAAPAAPCRPRWR